MDQQFHETALQPGISHFTCQFNACLLFSPGWLEGQLLSYEVAKRRSKPLQQIRALKRAIEFSGPNDPGVHEILSDWLLTAPSIKV